MDLITAYVINTHWVGRSATSSDLPHAPVVAEFKATHKASPARAAIAAALLRASQAVAPS
jgi:hypothetical protein